MSTITITLSPEAEKKVVDLLTEIAAQCLFQMARPERATQICCAYKPVEKSDVQDLLSIDDVLQSLSISRTTLYQWRRDGLLRYSRIGRRVFIFKDDLEQCLRNHSHMAGRVR